MGAAYGFSLGIPFVPLGMLIGSFVGTLYGAIAGLPFGILGGAVLFVVALVLGRRDLLGDVGRHRRTAGWACAAARVLAFASFWGVTIRRADDSFSARVALTRDLPEVLFSRPAPRSPLREPLGGRA